eukprot:CAMPEP_0118893998 /NCGR_PEP_ID=MMETSP1166-20130328/2972_1 /TAXON_ID=1104430 /ORGANISM="Chrysoreinhardia sp, Strain CCMP3193" /LENGTH=129 /DNA_ID=CAMNT_0006832867 /DNA_START=66 /DNA_END=452 /DNA_ORIENTATION=-
MITYSGQSDRLNCATPGGRAFKEGEDKTLAKKASARYYGASLLFRTVASNSVGVPDSKNSTGTDDKSPGVSDRSIEGGASRRDRTPTYQGEVTGNKQRKTETYLACEGFEAFEGVHSLFEGGMGAVEDG